MAPLILALAAAAAAASAPANSPSVSDWRPMIAQAARRCGIPGPWIERVMQVESGGRTMLGGMPIRSRIGAIGLMQLMPRTWATMRDLLALGSDPDDPHDNILAGGCYLRMMYDRFGGAGMFAAYNAGPARYADYLATGRALPPETIAYLLAVGGSGQLGDRGATQPPSLFSIRLDPRSTSYNPVFGIPVSPLFAVRHDGP